MKLSLLNLEILSQLQDESMNTAKIQRKDARHQGVDQCYNCKRYLTCSQKYNNDIWLCTGFVPTEKYFM